MRKLPNALNSINDDIRIFANIGLFVFVFKNIISFFMLQQTSAYNGLRLDEAVFCERLEKNIRVS